MQSRSPFRDRGELERGLHACKDVAACEQTLLLLYKLCHTCHFPPPVDELSHRMAHTSKDRVSNHLNMVRYLMRHFDLQNSSSDGDPNHRAIVYGRLQYQQFSMNITAAMVCILTMHNKSALESAEMKRQKGAINRVFDSCSTFIMTVPFHSRKLFIL